MSASMTDRDRWWSVIGYEVSMLRFTMSISGSAQLNNVITEVKVLHTRNLCDFCVSSLANDIKPSDLFDAYDTDQRYGRLNGLVQKLAQQYGRGDWPGDPRWAFNKMAMHPTKERDTSFDYTPHLARVLPVLFEIIAEMDALRERPSPDVGRAR
jgi:hypothetical protein